MNATTEEHVATLVHPDEYMWHLNQVTSLSTKNIIFLKRKFISRSGWELVSYPVSDCAQINYKDEISIMVVLSGLLLTALLSGICYLLFIYWNDLKPSTKIPFGAIGIAWSCGLRWIIGSRCHIVTFKLKDGTKLNWKSHSGDHKNKVVDVQNVVKFAKSVGLFVSSEFF